MGTGVGAFVGGGTGVGVLLPGVGTGVLAISCALMATTAESNRAMTRFIMEKKPNNVKITTQD